MFEIPVCPGPGDLISGSKQQRVLGSENSCGLLFPRPYERIKKLCFHRKEACRVLDSWQFPSCDAMNLEGTLSTVGKSGWASSSSALQKPLACPSKWSRSSLEQMARRAWAGVYLKHFRVWVFHLGPALTLCVCMALLSTKQLLGSLPECWVQSFQSSVTYLSWSPP